MGGKMVASELCCSFTYLPARTKFYLSMRRVSPRRNLTRAVPCSRCQGCPSARSPPTLPPWMLSQIVHWDPPSELDWEAIVRSRSYVCILLLLLVFSLNRNTCIPTSEECLAVPLYLYESQTLKLRCTWFCLRQFMYLYFDLKAGLVLLIFFYKGTCWLTALLGGGWCFIPQLMV